MATGTGDGGVGADKWEDSSCVVVKSSGSPGGNSVTQFTVCGELGSSMRRSCGGCIFIHVTARTISWDPRIPVGMTADAAYPDVTSGEWKGCSCIVIERGWCPCCWGMTGFTVS